MIYLWGNHGYTPPYPYPFETNCELSVEEMEKLGYEVQGAGRLAVTFPEYMDLLQKKGYVANPISMSQKDENYEKIVGIDGNY